MGNTASASLCCEPGKGRYDDIFNNQDHTRDGYSTSSVVGSVLSAANDPVGKAARAKYRVDSLHRIAHTCDEAWFSAFRPAPSRQGAAPQLQPGQGSSGTASRARDATAPSASRDIRRRLSQLRMEEAQRWRSRVDRGHLDHSRACCALWSSDNYGGCERAVQVPSNVDLSTESLVGEKTTSEASGGTAASAASRTPSPPTSQPTSQRLKAAGGTAGGDLGCRGSIIGKTRSV